MKDVYIALLRGVNVSGKNAVKMKELELALQANGFQQVVTCIQSGNIIFKHHLSENELIAKKINKVIASVFNLDIPVIVLSKTEFKKLLVNMPYVEKAKDEPTKVLITFLAAVPQPEFYANFIKINPEHEEFNVAGKVVYLYCKNGYGKAKINNNFIESKLKVKATTRNWKTVLKLFEIGESL